MTDIKARIEKLNNSNYSIWKFKMELLLIKESLWKVINEVESKPVLAADLKNKNEVDEWNKLDDQARALIGLTVEDDQLAHIRKSTTAVQVWNNLREYHQKGTLSNRVHLMRTICSLKMDEGGNAVEHINKMQDLFLKLSDIGEEALSDNWSVAMLLSSLPRNYDTLIMALETRPEAELTFALVQQKVIAEFERRMNADRCDPVESVLRSVSKASVCFFCKKSGHMKKDCDRYKIWKSKNESGEDTSHKANQAQEYNFTFLALSGMKQRGWLLDSGATRHMTNNKKFFSSLDEIYGGIVEVGNGESVQIKGRGTGRLEFLDENDNSSHVTAHEVLYVPAMVGNLLSVSRLVENGLTIEFNKTQCEIKKNGIQLGVADKVNNLYQLRQTHAAYSVIECHKENCIHDWHRKLGHRDPEALRKMQSDGLVEGLNIVECGVKVTCDTCIKGKFHRLPFPKKSLSKSKELLELIHSDVAGPMQTMSRNGHYYLVTFIDDYSRFTYVRTLKEKSDVESTCRDFIEMVKNKFGKKPKIFRSDRGGEYIGKRFLQFLKSEGIESQFTASYSPQQNGVAERKNRTIMEMARCMLIDAEFPNNFWGEAVATSVHIQNHVITRSTGVTPFERWNGQKPSLKNFHIFGSKCFVYVPKEKRRKLDNTAIEMKFLGYDNYSKAYRCYDPVAKKVVISRDVQFSSQFSSIENPEQNSSGAQISSFVDEQLCINTNNNVKSAVNNIIEEEANGTPIQEETIIDQESVQDLSDGDNDSELEFFTPQAVRVSNRINKGKPPRRLIDEMHIAHDQIDEPTNYNEAIKSKYKEKWIEAMKDEMQSIKDNGTWELADLPKDRKAIGCKWLYKVKTNIDGSIQRFKARLVAKGFSQKYGTDYDEVFAPVVRQMTIRTLLSISAKRNLCVEHLDVKTAFLNGDLKETIYMKQPTGFVGEDSSKVCLLKKSIYGLKQAARVWNEAIHKVLITDNFEQSKVDQCLYMKNINGNWCYVLLYVDDIIAACNSSEEVQQIERLIGAKFELKNLGPITQFLGIEVTRDTDGNFQLCQSKYIKQIALQFGLMNAKSANTPMEVNYGKSSSSVLLIDNVNYQKLIGSLLYVSVNTRPDIAASISILARKVSEPNEEDWNQLKRVVKYLKSTADLKLYLSDNQEEKQELFGYADANWAEDKATRKSNSGYVFFFNGGVIGWACRKQGCVSLSSTEAEFIALSDACQEIAWLRRLLSDIHIDCKEPTLLYEDNQSCLKLIKEEKFSNRTKHIDTKFHFVKDYMDKGVVKCEYCPTGLMVADLLTKPLPVVKHIELRDKCKLV